MLFTSVAIGRISGLALAALLTVSLAACEEEQGAAEQLGEKLDETVKQTTESIENAFDELKEGSE